MTRKEQMAYHIFKFNVISTISRLNNYAEEYDCKGVKNIAKDLQDSLDELNKKIK